MDLLIPCGLEAVVEWLRKMLPSAVPRLEDHVSIWSVTARDARTFFRIVGALWLVALAYIVYKTGDQGSAVPGGVPLEQVWRSVGDTTLAVLVDFGSVGIAIAIVSMLLTRAVNTIGELFMSLYQAMVNRFVIPVIEAHKEEGRAEGLVQGVQQERAEWRGWNERRLAAEREGREFAEPPPEG